MQMFEQQEQTLKDYGLQKEPLELAPGTVLMDKDGKKSKGPPISRENKMTLQEYAKIA